MREASDDDSNETFKDYNDQDNFRASSKSFFLTYPQCPLKLNVFFENLKRLIDGANRNIEILLCSSEKHKKTSGSHIHVYFELDNKINVKRSDYFDLTIDCVTYHPNIQRPRNKVKIIRYISGMTKGKKNTKFDLFQYRFDYKEYLSSSSQHRKYIYHDLIQKNISINEAVEILPSMIINYSRLKTNLSSYWNDCDKKVFKSKRICYWIIGSPGIGKSYSVREAYGSQLYLKSPNKWWDGYQGQMYVLLDDLDSPFLSYYLKIWTDNYLFYGEIKGGIVECSYRVMFITSNYRINEIFKDDTLVKAIERRVNVIDANECMNGDYFKISDEIKDEIKKIVNS